MSKPNNPLTKEDLIAKFEKDFLTPNGCVSFWACTHAGTAEILATILKAFEAGEKAERAREKETLKTLVREEENKRVRFALEELLANLTN